jgi:hypothetical protein
MEVMGKMKFGVKYVGEERLCAHSEALKFGTMRPRKGVRGQSGRDFVG